MTSSYNIARRDVNQLYNKPTNWSAFMTQGVCPPNYNVSPMSSGHDWKVCWLPIEKQRGYPVSEQNATHNLKVIHEKRMGTPSLYGMRDSNGKYILKNYRNVHDRGEDVAMYRYYQDKGYMYVPKDYKGTGY